jgi:hypothetical protein
VASCSDTSSAAAASTPVVGPTAAAFAVLIADPIPAKSEAAVTSASGAATTKDIRNSPCLGPIWVRRSYRDREWLAGWSDKESAGCLSCAPRAGMVNGGATGAWRYCGAYGPRHGCQEAKCWDARMKFDRGEVTPTCR